MADPHLPTWKFTYKVKLRGTVVIQATDQRAATAIFQKVNKLSLIQNINNPSMTTGPTATVLGLLRIAPTNGPNDDPFPSG